MKVIYVQEGRDTLVAATARMLEEPEGVRYLDETGTERLEDHTVKVNGNYSGRILSRLKENYSLNLIGLGDVGGNVLLGLKLLGGKTLTSIGLYNPDEAVSRRYELEMNQIYSEHHAMEIPVRVIDPLEIFQADVVVFTASVGVPAVGDEAVDVRKVQFEGNARILSQYVRQAVEAGFEGLLLIVSDPVDLLCKAALDASEGGLLPSQIAGFGQGVMYARARYYARQMGIEQFERDGRIYGPHGAELVVANSLSHYDDALSRALTRKTVEANLAVRALGFKPFIAPAFSSGALSILAFLRGKNVYASHCLGGYFFGLYGRMTGDGLWIETAAMPEELMERIEESYREMKNDYEQHRTDR